MENKMVKHMTKERAQQHLYSIMDWFEFEEVHKVMTTLDWVWVESGGEKVPEMYQLKEQVKRLFWECFNNEEQGLVTIGCGGFWVSLNKQQDYVDCRFTVTSWESYGEDFENE